MDTQCNTEKNERVHVHNERNSPQAKLHSDVNVPFLLNEHGDLYFLSHNNSVHIILLNIKKIKRTIGRKKKIWCDFSTNFIILFYILDTSYLSCFFPKYYFIT